MLVIERIKPNEFRAYEFEIGEVWMEVFEDKISELHKSGFVRQDIKRPSNISGLVFDNLLLTEKGLDLIDLGISALKSQVAT
jgi:serine/threonine protein kinase